MKSPERILLYFMGIVFLFAGLYRLFSFSSAVQEFQSLNLPVFLLAIVVVIEIAGGLLLLLQKYVKHTILVLCTFLAVALLVVFIPNAKEILSSFTELAVFTPDPVVVFLHLTYLIILITLFFIYSNCTK